MLQRIGLAQAMVQEPRLLVLDEPTAGVDPAGSREIRDLILDFKKRGITVLLCSHLLGQVQEICDRIGILHRGVLVREGKLEDLISIENQTELILENASPELLARNSGRGREIAGARSSSSANRRRRWSAISSKSPDREEHDRRPRRHSAQGFLARARRAPSPRTRCSSSSG